MAALPELSTLGTGGALLAFVSYRRWLWRLSLARRFIVFVVLVLLPGLAAAAVIATVDPLHLRDRPAHQNLVCNSDTYDASYCPMKRLGG